MLEIINSRVQATDDTLKLPMPLGGACFCKASSQPEASVGGTEGFCLNCQKKRQIVILQKLQKRLNTFTLGKAF